MSEMKEKVRLTAGLMILYLIDGRGSEPDGIGREVDENGTSKKSISLTKATELYYGTSGRGNSTAKGKLISASVLGFLKLDQRGSRQYVFITKEGYKVAEEYLGTERPKK